VIAVKFGNYFQYQCYCQYQPNNATFYKTTRHLKHLQPYTVRGRSEPLLSIFKQTDSVLIPFRKCLFWCGWERCRYGTGAGYASQVWLPAV